MISTDFSYAFEKPTDTLQLKTHVADFIVDEILGFDPEGEGEHIYVKIKKTGENTDYVAKQLARFIKVKPNDVGFCGMKDRHGITTQWFSIYTPTLKTEPDWARVKNEHGINIDIMEITRHTKKLRRGMHQANHFDICLRGNIKPETLNPRLEKIKRDGVPNYFGEQRFGRNANNLHDVENWVNSGAITKNRHKRGLIISSARSYLFNLVVSERIKQENWRRCIPGDVPSEVHAQYGTAPLWGRGYSKAQDDAAAIEKETLAPFAGWLDKLEHCGLNQERRDLVCLPRELDWQLDADSLRLQFSLAPGQYATSVVREMVQTLETDRHISRSDSENQTQGQV